MKTAMIRLTILTVLCVALLGGYLAHLQISGNFHPVVAGVAYRSAQPSAEDLALWTAETGLRSVINLRGAHEGAAWYDSEMAGAAALGLVHYDFQMSAGKQLTLQDAARLVALLRAAPKPVLIHCKSGSDRTGLASAMLMADLGENEARAERQISIRYGHVSLPYTAAWPMDQSWEALEGWLGYAS
ncbi:tyrosine-protein phosphatase [Falsirhodobacter sp. alg1]|uniref:tyrosine-protein phosphatase n=1 Tax=Falsirhodobacter sp. alg1 TaxID=1472418 RepID=UPI0005EF8EAA|nr:tyrosine-protein phosphatase [Falsirhodobacter sp. alg1]